MTLHQTFIIGGDDVDRHNRALSELRAHFRTLDKSRRWRVIIEPYTRKRTTNQNNLYWSWMSLIADETGNDKDDVHEFLLAKFCPTKSITVVEEEVTRESTKLLNTVEMKDYMDKVMAWAATTLNITLPLPEDGGQGE